MGTAVSKLEKNKMAENQNLEQFFSFRMGSEYYAIRLTQLQEILERPKIVQIPFLNPLILGVANLRGAPVPILSFTASTKKVDYALIVSIDNENYGLVIDHLGEILHIDPNKCEIGDGLRESYKDKHIWGIFSNNTTLVYLWNFQSWFMQQEFEQPRKAKEIVKALAQQLG